MRRQSGSSISFFSLQDIVMSVTGVMLLIVMLLILKIIMQPTDDQSTSVPEISEVEINKQIESQEETLREIQDEIAKLNQSRQNAAPYLPSLDEIDALQHSIARLEGDIESIEKDIKTVKEEQKELKNRPELELVEDTEKRIPDLKQLCDDLKNQLIDLQNQIDVKTRQEQTSQSKLNALNREKDGLEKQWTTDGPKKVDVFVEPHLITEKTPHILVYGANMITIHSLDAPKHPFLNEQEFYRWADGRDREKEYIVVFARPSRFETTTNTPDCKKVLDKLREMGFDVGLQVISENTEITLRQENFHEVPNVP